MEDRKVRKDDIDNKEKKDKKEVDMLHGPLAMKLILFALPLALSSILQQLFNSADVAVVGRYAGSDALAAVGANVANVGVFVNLMVGASAGPNIVIANMIGTGKRDEVSKAVHTIMTMAILGGLLLMGIGMAIARPLLLSTNTPAGILGAAELYLRVYLIGIPFILIYNFGSAILRSIGDTKRPLYVMLISGAINVGLNLLFVIGFDMEVLGVAVATVISNVLSAGMIILILIREQGMIHLDLRKLQLNRLYAGRVIRFAIPSGIQGMVFSVSNIFVQSGINVFGEDAIAGSSAALNFEYFTYAISAAFAQGTVTFTSQNYGAGRYDRCRRIFWLTLAEGIGFTALLCAVFVIFRIPFVRIYTTDEAVIRYALVRMMRVMALEALTATYEVGAASLRSMNYAIIPVVLTILGTVGFRIVYIYTVFQHFHTFEQLMIVYPASWIFTGALMLIFYAIIVSKRLPKAQAETKG